MDDAQEEAVRIVKGILGAIAVSLILAGIVGAYMGGQTDNRRWLCESGYADDLCQEFGR